MDNRDYELIADVISKLPEKYISKAGLVIDLAKAFVANNSLFDIDRFIIVSMGFDTKLDFKDQDAVAAEFNLILRPPLGKRGQDSLVPPAGLEHDNGW